MTGVLGRFTCAFLAALLVGAGLTACSSDKKTLKFCTDPSYPPAEYYTVGKVGSASLKRNLVGADIDIAHEVAKRTKSTAQFVSTPFDTITQALVDKKCDAIISFMNDTPDRRQRLSFVDYLAAGQTVMLKKSAAPVNSVADLGGRSAAVARGTTEESFLKSQSSSTTQINIKSFATENDAILAVKKGQADVYFGDDPIVQATVAADSSLTVGPQLVKPIPVGIALRQGDSRVSGIKQAVKAMYEDGKMGAILTRWKFNRYAINP
jgi:polar amino acid transport system substrate-binding protein